MNRVFNVVAVYLDDGGGTYEWQGEADDAADAERKAQLQAWVDNCPKDAAAERTPVDMLGEMRISDVTVAMVAKSETIGFLRDMGKLHLAERVEMYWT